MKACTCIALFLYILCGKAASQDVDTFCPSDVWEVGEKITLMCTVSKTKFPSQCVTNFPNEVRFRKGNDGFNFNTDCTVSSATPCAVTTVDSGTCGCVSDSPTQFVYNYTFIASHDFEGYWDCNIPCNNGLTPQLTYKRSAGCDNVQVMEKTCNVTASKCTNGGTDSCKLLDDGDVLCGCKKGHKPPVCEKCGTKLDDDTCVDGLIAAGFVIFYSGIIIGAIVAALFVFCYRKERKCHLNPKGTIGSRDAMSDHVEDVKKKIGNSRLYELCDVRVIEDHVVIRGRNLCSVCKVETAIERIINESNPGSHNVTPAPEMDPSITEPTPDYKNAKQTEHKATGRPRNGVADEHV